MNTSVTIDDFAQGLANNGPWAILAGYLLKKVLDAWTGDRAQVTVLLGEFKSTLDSFAGALTSLKVAVDHLSGRLEITDNVPSK